MHITRQLMERPRLRRFLVFGGVWACIVIVFALQMQLVAEMPLRDALVRSLSRWSPWIILCPLIFALTARYPLLRRDGLLRNAMIHLVLSIAIVLLVQIFAEVVALPVERRLTAPLQPARGDLPRPTGPPPRHGMPPPRAGHETPPPRPERPPPDSGRPEGPPWLRAATRHLPHALPTYWALLGIQSILLFGAQLRQREQESSALQGKLTQARLDALKLQLQPHFLFNALNAISTLLHREPKTADRMIGHLSTLLRGVLEERDATEVPLVRELELLHAYVAIEEMRFGERVRFEEDIADNCLQALVPVLLLQPIVENAVRHGLEPAGRPGFVRLSAKRIDDRLQLRIEDDGIGRNGGSAGGLGIGLANTGAQLEALHGPDAFTLNLEDRDGGGTSVTIELPFHTGDA